MTRNIGQFGIDLEGQIRKELGTATPISWKEEVNETHQSSKSTRNDVLAAIWGGKLGIRGLLVFDLPASCPTQLRTGIIQPGINSCVATLHFSTDLRKPINGKITFVKNNSGIGRFEGNASLCELMNTQKEIVSIASALYREKYTLGNLTVKINPQLALESDGDSTHLDLLTVPYFKKKFITGTIIYSVKEYLQLASLIDTALSESGR